MVCYKSIYINTYNILLINLQTKMIVYHYQSKHMWEVEIRSILLENQDLVIFSDSGKKVISLAQSIKKKVRNQEGRVTMLHSLNSCQDLKLEPSNYLLFSQDAEGLKVTILEQYRSEIGETSFESIYNFSINEASLMDLLLFQSIFVCRQQFYIVNLIKKQVKIDIFLKAFLEFNKANLVQILSFDSKSIAALLDKSNEKYFRVEYPIIYKLSQQDYQMNKSCGGHQHSCTKVSAIDTAIQNNQVRALAIMIDYITKYQNSYVYSYLFQDNLIKLMEMGIEISHLLRSNVFVYKFDFQEWPSIHHENLECIRPYYLTIF